jgi:membrane protein YqaA with SNARE-associated domain
MSLFLDVKIWLLVLLLSILGTVAALSFYYLGKRGTKAVLARFPQLKKERWEKLQDLYQEHGTGLLLLSSIPMVGGLLIAAAGAFGIGVSTFFLWVLASRVVRNWLVLLLFDQTLGFLLGR